LRRSETAKEAEAVAMLITHEREKLLQAINFFVRNTRKCGKVKLFKLLYFLDFEHFKITGRSVTGLNYDAWPMGPVPVSLHNELEAPEPDMADAFQIEKIPIRQGAETMLKIQPQINFSDLHFTKRESDLMTKLAAEYIDANSDDMIEATHLENKPWDKIYNQEGKKQQRIPYELAIRPDEMDEIKRVSKDREELLGRLR
jgi:uncharacterized phage-associated protein